jgi:hypothetical protein
LNCSDGLIAEQVNLEVFCCIVWGWPATVTSLLPKSCTRSIQAAAGGGLNQKRKCRKALTLSVVFHQTFYASGTALAFRFLERANQGTLTGGTELDTNNSVVGLTNGEICVNPYTTNDDSLTDILQSFPVKIHDFRTVSTVDCRRRRRFS